MAKQKHQYNFLFTYSLQYVTLLASWHNMCLNVSNIIICLLECEEQRKRDVANELIFFLSLF